jgi:hypothetical protein
MFCEPNLKNRVKKLAIEKSVNFPVTCCMICSNAGQVVAVKAAP